MKAWKHIVLVIAVPFLAAAGYGVMKLIAHHFPIDENNLAIEVLTTLLMITFGLGVPYWMLKLGFLEAHLNNPDEKELTLKDLPKDKTTVNHIKPSIR